jgi:hypothetical protein
MAEAFREIFHFGGISIENYNASEELKLRYVSKSMPTT